MQVPETESQLTAIEWFVLHLKALHAAAYDTDDAIKVIEQKALAYERQYNHDIVKKAISEGVHIGSEHSPRSWESDKQAYLNQHYPLGIDNVTGNEISRKWVVGDVFVTNFWSTEEVCIIRIITDEHVQFNRLESIRGIKHVARDFCSATMELELFAKIKKRFIHHSDWYYEYK